MHVVEGVDQSPCRICSGAQRSRAHRQQATLDIGVANLLGAHLLQGPVGQAGAVGQDGDEARCGPAGQHRVAGLIDRPDVAREQDPPSDHSRDRVSETDHSGDPVIGQIAQAFAQEPGLGVARRTLRRCRPLAGRLQGLSFQDEPRQFQTLDIRPKFWENVRQYLCLRGNGEHRDADEVGPSSVWMNMPYRREAAT